MEATKRERIILFGVVPVLAALAGSVGTVVATKYFGSTEPADALLAVAKAQALTAAQRLELITAINKNDQQFYDFMRTMLFAAAVPVGAIFYAVAEWIRTR